MINLKWLRQPLLGGAALSVLATGVQADELSTLKAQLEALQSRVNQLETTSAHAPLPAGTKLLTVRNGQGAFASSALPMRASDIVGEHNGYTIAVTPTADMPAPVSEVSVSGEIRARLLYSNIEIDGGSIDLDANDAIDLTTEVDGFDTDDFDITTRARLNVEGRTETCDWRGRRQDPPAGSGWRRRKPEHRLGLLADDAGPAICRWLLG